MICDGWWTTDRGRGQCSDALLWIIYSILYILSSNLKPETNPIAHWLLLSSQKADAGRDKASMQCSAVLCNVANCRWAQTVKRGNPHQGSRDQERERAECSHEARQHQADNHGAGQGFIEASLANIQFEFKQAQTDFDWPKGMNKTKPIGESQNMPDVF